MLEPQLEIQARPTQHQDSPEEHQEKIFVPDDRPCQHDNHLIEQRPNHGRRVHTWLEQYELENK